MTATTLPDITATPAPNQHISHNGTEYTTVKEGLAHILIPASSASVPQNDPRGENQSQSVFYNPIQQFNRDLSVLAIKAYGEEVMEQKNKEMERKRESLAAKKDKKRKREAAGEGPRKAGKLNGAAEKGDGDGEAVPKSEESSDIKADAVVKEEDGSEKEVKAENTTETEKSLPITEKTATKVPSFTILDALSATGLRALRYAQEIPFTTSVTANDLLAEATKSIALNVKHNKLEDKIVPVTGNALAHMYNLACEDTETKGRFKPSKKYDVIDLDPYGTAVPFIDAAVQSVRDDGGLLCVTCTDAGVWASNGYPEKCYSLYGGMPMKGPHSHEGGLRLILHSIATAAARYGMSIEPLLSLSIDFYARVFVRVRKSPADVKFLAGKTMLVYNCDQGCGAWTTQMLAKNKLTTNKSGTGTFYKHLLNAAPTAGENCEHCGFKTHLAGPMYAGPIHSLGFIKRILDDLPNVSKDTYQTTTRIEGMLSMALQETIPPLEETPVEPVTKHGKASDPAAIDLYPFYVIPAVLSKVIHCTTPHENALRGALRYLGYRVTRSHSKAGSIKTDAPWEIIWHVMREWARQKAPIKEGANKEGTSGHGVMNKEVKEEVKEREVVFDEELGKERDGKNLVRYQRNPRENWGPMSRAKGHS